ncbi:MAG: ATP-dependent 6-phosphofructokinase [Alphaproteobacteria bacterium]
MKKKIGIITSGGDCAGLNATIRAIVQCAKLKYNWDVVGIHRGGSGLMSSPIQYEELDVDFHGFSHVLLRMGGTILGTTTKGNPLAFHMANGQIVDRSQEMAKNYHALGLDALIVTGGDGSLKIMNEVARRGKMNIVCIPKTIDNDISMTEALGFETAVNVAMEALDRLQPTAASHDRVMILELMGRDAGHITLSAGIAGGADIILIPEVPFSIAAVVDKIKTIMKTGRNFALIAVSEAAYPKDGEPHMVHYKNGSSRYGGIGHFLMKEIDKHMDIETRVTVLGHVQRGGEPVARDRILASAFGVYAVDLVAQGKFGRMVAWQGRELTDVDILEAVNSYHTVDLKGTLVKTARGLGISFGES